MSEKEVNADSMKKNYIKTACFVIVLALMCSFISGCNKKEIVDSLVPEENETVQNEADQISDNEGGSESSDYHAQSDQGLNTNDILPTDQEAEKDTAVSSDHDSHTVVSNNDASGGSAEKTLDELQVKYGIDPAKSYVTPKAWEKGIFIGNGEDGTDLVYDENGRFLFTLSMGDSFDHEEGEAVFIGEYAKTRNGKIVDRTGKEVFSLEDSEFDRIVNNEMLDVGYMICAKDVNTFEDTSTHLYAVNIKDGTNFELKDFEKEPATEEIGNEWRYYGDGYFVKSPPGIGFYSSHHVYNILTKKIAPVHMTNEDGTTQEDNRLPYIYSLKDKIWYHDHTLYYCKNHVVYEENLETCEVHPMKFSDGSVVHSTEGGLKRRKYYVAKNENTDSYYTLFNPLTKEEVPMNLYKKFSIARAFKDGEILASIENEGGGRFVTVVEKSGKYRFEPIPNKVDHVTCGRAGFVVCDEENKYVMYDYSGKQLAVSDRPKVYVGDKTFLYEVKSEDQEHINYVLLNAETGKSILLPDDLIIGGDGYLGYENGGYILRAKLVHAMIVKEDGTFLYLEK